MSQRDGQEAVTCYQLGLIPAKVSRWQRFKEWLFYPDCYIIHVSGRVGQ